jgi:hypothetical protein
MSADDFTDIMPFLRHVAEMTTTSVKCVLKRHGYKTSVKSVLKRHGYRCTNKSDLRMVTGWLEMLVILREVVPNGGNRQGVWDWVKQI